MSKRQQSKRAARKAKYSGSARARHFKTQFGFYYPSYDWGTKEYDPILDAIFTLQSQAGRGGRPVTFRYIHEKSGVTVGTLSRWRKRLVRRPSFPAIKAVVRALGGRLEVTVDGKVIK